ncbi:hypothetical protein L1887_15440 [Cichorium endivia]|nr:hypothetical protein L1887_15440 [Cichorium endivia]
MMVGANMKERQWFRLNSEQRLKAIYPFPEDFRPTVLSGLTLSGLMQKQLWEAYKANDPDMLLPQTNDMDHHNSLTPGDCDISHSYDLTTDSDDQDGDRTLIPVSNETQKNERIEKEILRRLEKGKNKVEEVEETLEDRIVNRMEGFFHERMDRLENKIEWLENRVVEMTGLVVNRTGRFANKKVEMEGVVAQRMESLRSKMVEVEEGVMDRMEKLTNMIVEMEREPYNKVEEGLISNNPNLVSPPKHRRVSSCDW